ncbi:MAG: hypothetical protein KC457_21575, partial [Myxococcales bacterium]|nr:hypothetical protein [Myxococcales bacterium]
WGYEDAEHDEVFADALLRSLAAVAELLPPTFAAYGGADPTGARNLTKRWLAAMAIPGRRADVLTKVGVDKEVAKQWGQVPLRDLVPALSHDSLLAGEHPLLALPLFVDFDGARMSLADLGHIRQQRGAIAYIPWRTSVEPLGKMPRVARLGVDDLAIVEALFGKQAVASWEEDYKKHRAKAAHMRKEVEDIDGTVATLEHEFTEVGLDPGLFLRRLPEGPRHGLVAIAIETTTEVDADDLAFAGVSLLWARRSVCDLELDLGFPAVAIVDDPDLSYDDEWSAVAEDQRFVELVALLKSMVIEMVEALCRAFETLPAPMQRNIGRVLLHTAAKRATAGKESASKRKRKRKQDRREAPAEPHLTPMIEDLPLLPVIGGPAISLARTRILLAEHKRLEAVEEAVDLAVPDPPILVVDDLTRPAIETLLATTLVDGLPRLRTIGLGARLETLRPIGTPELDAETVLIKLPFPGGEGEIGFARRREQGMRVTLGCSGRYVGEAGDENHELPIDAVLVDDALPLTIDEDGRPAVDGASKHVRGVLRRCRRVGPDLILALCTRWPALDGDDAAQAWSILLRQILLEHKRNQERRDVRERALERAMAVPGFRDIWGKRWSLEDLQRFVGTGPLEVLGKQPRELPQAQDAESLGRVILLTTELERSCLASVLPRVIDVGDRWSQLLAELDDLRRAPRIPFEIPAEVLSSTRITAAGGLEVLLWLPRHHDPRSDRSLTLAFTQNDRVIAQESVLRALPCAGVVKGALQIDAMGKLELDIKQRSGLERQLVAFYEGLVGRARSNKLSSADQDRLLLYLAHAAHHLAIAGRDGEAIRRLGKRVPRLLAKLDETVPPVLRDAAAKRGAPTPDAPPPATPRVPEVSQAAADVPQAQPTEPEVQPEIRPEQAPEPALQQAVPARPIDPEQVLIAALYEQLRWARARHGSLLDELGLAQLRIGTTPGNAIVDPGRRALVVRRDHPIVARLLAQAEGGADLDPIDLSFVVAATYTLMNIVAEAIDDDDERAFVADLAQALALAGP